MIHVSFVSEICKANEILKDVIIRLKNYLPEIADEKLFELRLIYSELLFNAIIHGNKYDLSKKVNLKIEVDQMDIFSSIEDEGNGFDYIEILNSEKSLNPALSEHGRGIWLVDSLTDYLKFNETGNKVEFRKKLSA